MDPFFFEELELLALDTELLDEELVEELLEDDEPSLSARAGRAEVMAIVAVIVAARSFPYFIRKREKEIE